LQPASVATTVSERMALSGCSRPLRERGSGTVANAVCKFHAASASSCIGE
jgi:hypothetical protein